MRRHRNPRPRLPRPPSTHNTRRRLKLSPDAEGALRSLLGALDGIGARKAMRLAEALSAFVTFATRGRP